MANGNHVWKFFRAGGFDQVNLQSGADIANLDALDQKLWVALSCPTRGLEFDPKTLDLIDTDKDGRIRAPELIAAAKWACGNLKNPDQLLKPSPALALNSIQDGTPEGKQLLDEIFRRFRNNECSFKQAKILKKYGYAGPIKRDQAKALIDRIAANGWRAVQ